MLRFALLLGLVGLAAATGLIVWSGWHQVLDALAIAGWGIVWTSLFHLVPMLCCVVGWRALLPGKKRPSLGYFLYILWLRTSVNNLMPVARIGGEVVAVRIMVRDGMRRATAVACTVVELTTSVMAVFVFSVIGIAMFAVHVNDHNAVRQLALGLLLSAPLIGAMVYVQRVGFFGLLSRLFTLLFRETWKKYAGDARRLDRAVNAMYRRTGRVIFCGVLQWLGWAAGTGEIWLALHFLGHPLPLAETVMIEALIQATSSAAFAVPGALGVQEAGFLLFGGMLGLTPEIAAALAVMRRCRDVLLYVPGLVAWQVGEGRRLVGGVRG
jgi:putative membrane protein